MIKITRNEYGNHFVSGLPFVQFIPETKLYRKKTLTRAVQMLEPFSVETLEGTMEGNAGDWLMIGIKGEMYPCDADVFEMTYEKVDKHEKS